MSNLANKRADASSADNLKRTFETAFAELQKKREPAKAPIAVRNQTVTPGDLADEKRALTNAARALAELWNISPSLVR